MKPLNTKEKPLSLLDMALIFIAFVLLSLLLSCSQKEMPQYKVKSVEKIKGHNAYMIETDSFRVVRVIKGGFNYRPKTISKQGYKIN